MVKSRDNHLLSFVWLLLLILPSNQVFYLFVPIAFIYLYDRRIQVSKKTNLYVMGAVILLFISILVNISELYVANKDYFRAIEIIILFFTFSKLKGDSILKPYIIIAFLYLLLSQLTYLFNLTAITSFFESIYPISEDYENRIQALQSINLSNYGTTRLGGIFHNPNQFARYIQLITVVLLCEIRQFNKKELFILILLIIISTLATGSRTSLIVLLLIGIGYLYFTHQLRGKKLFFYLLGITSIGIFLMLQSVSFSEFRALKFDEGLDDSFGVKLILFIDYINKLSEILPLLFGNMSGEVLIVKYGSHTAGTDFDFGNILVVYGFLFYILLFSFYLFIYRRTAPKYRIIFAVLFWIFSSSVLISYRMAPLFFLVMGLYYRRSIQEKNIYNN